MPEAKVYKKQLDDYSNKIIIARELLLKGELDGSDYRIIKNDCERQISILEGKLLNSSSKNIGIGSILTKALSNTSMLPELYQRADIQEKRTIISSMYPENLTFDGEQHRLQE